MRSLSRVSLRSVLTTVALIGSSVAVAAVLDNFGPPPPGDPSEFTGPAIGNGAAIDALARLAPANEGAFEGGPTGTAADTHQNIVTPPAPTGVDIPSGAPPSPLFGAQPFTQQLLLL